jgi:hypothetical protein
MSESIQEDIILESNSIHSQSNLLPPQKCQAYIAIFEDALDQLAVLGDITPEIYNKNGDKLLADNITKILKDQRNLEDQYANVVHEQDSLKALPNKSLYKQGQMEMFDLNNGIHASTQALAKRLKSHPSVVQNLLKIQQERNSLQTLISKTIRDLRECRFDSLINAVEEEYKKKNTLQNTINRENEAYELLKELQAQLANEKKLLEDEANDRNQVIQQLKDTIQEINSLTASEQKYIKKEIKAHENSVRQQCQTKENSLTDMKSNLQKKIEIETRVHQKCIDFLDRQRQDLENSIQDWMTKYEEDTERKANELESLRQNRTNDLDKFEDLMMKYEELNKIVEDDRLNKERIDQEKKWLKKLNRAAKIIQRFYRNCLKKRKETQVNFIHLLI